MRLKSTVKWLVYSLIVVALAGGVWRALKARSDAQASAALAAEALKAPINYVLQASDTVAAARQSLDQTQTINGTVKAVNAVTLRSNQAAIVTAIRVPEGGRVKAGQVVAQLDADDANARREQAQQQVIAARAQMDLAQRQRDNNRALVEKGFISSTALVSSDSTYASAKANHEAAIAALDIAKRNLADATVRSPINWQVSQRYVKPGDRVALNAPLVDIVDTRSLEVEVMVPIAAAAKLQVGQMATLTLESSATTVTAKVARINPSVDASSRSLKIYLSLPVDSARVGEFVTGGLVVGTIEGSAIPLDAVRTEKAQPYIQVVQNQRVAHVSVTIAATGSRNGRQFAIVSPLNAGEIVLSPSAGVIANGTAVQLSK